MRVTEKFIYEDYVLQYPKTKLSFEQWFGIIKKLIWEIASEITLIMAYGYRLIRLDFCL